MVSYSLKIYSKLKLKEIETTKDSKSSPQTKQHWYQNFYGSPSPTSKERKTSHGGLDDNGAATRIQAGYLGYKVRKESKASPQSSPDKKTVGKEQSEVIQALLTDGFDNFWLVGGTELLSEALLRIKI